MEQSGDSPSTQPEPSGDSRPWEGKGSVFTWLRAHFPGLYALGDGISNADLPGWLGGAPRNPNLKPGKGREYSTVRTVEQGYAYTQIQTNELRCPKCGGVVEEHVVNNIDGDQNRHVVGSVRMCRDCQKDSWMFTSHMPSVLRAREKNEKTVM